MTARRKKIDEKPCLSIDKLNRGKRGHVDRRIIFKEFSLEIRNEGIKNKRTRAKESKLEIAKWKELKEK